MFKKILVVFLVLLALFAGVVAMQPAEFRVTRSTVIAAPAAVVFEQVNNLHNWDAWSPWAKLDPQAKHTFEGPDAGEGSVMRWAGNREVGVGSMTITESRANELVRFRLDFLEPFAATHNAEFTFSENSGQTNVSWSMYGTNNFVGKAMGLIMNCEKMIGGYFEKGLAQLKAVSEGTAMPQS